MKEIYLQQSVKVESQNKPRVHIILDKEASEQSHKPIWTISIHWNKWVDAEELARLEQFKQKS